MSEPASIVPVFPLPKVVLFPKLQLPLHIFEPRYRQMVRDAMAADGLIGMALLRGDWEQEYYGNPEIFSIGCLGKIVGATPLADGRYNILLHGLREYEVEEHILDATPYRQAKIVERDEPRPLDPASLATIKKEIFEIVGGVVEENSPLLKILADPSIDGATWLNLCCFSLDISVVEKQSLLEAKSLEARARDLIGVLRFMAAENRTHFNSARNSRAGKLRH